MTSQVVITDRIYSSGISHHWLKTDDGVGRGRYLSGSRKHFQREDDPDLVRPLICHRNNMDEAVGVAEPWYFIMFFPTEGMKMPSVAWNIHSYAQAFYVKLWLSDSISSNL